jgi:hypothetical protein
MIGVMTASCLVVGDFLPTINYIFPIVISKEYTMTYYYQCVCNNTNIFFK